MSNKVPGQNPLSLESSSKSELMEGGFYVVKRGELVRLERSEDDLPTVPMSQAAKDALLPRPTCCRRGRTSEAFRNSSATRSWGPPPSTRAWPPPT